MSTPPAVAYTLPGPNRKSLWDEKADGFLVHASCRAPLEHKLFAGKMIAPSAVHYAWPGGECAYCHGKKADPHQAPKVKVKGVQVDMFGPPPKPGGQRSLF